MRVVYVVHILMGAIALIAGYLALYAPKGAKLHRRGGTVFVATMLVMSVGGVMLALGRNAAPFINVPAASITAYLVITSLTTVRPLASGGRQLLVALSVLAMAVGLASLWFGVEAVSSANGRGRDGMPWFPFALFGLTGTLASLGDLRVLLQGPLTGARRLTRHLWRMTFALFIAAMSFFIGQAKVVPEPYRNRMLLALPVLAVLVTLLYWVWRVRFRGSLRGITEGRTARTRVPDAVPTR